ncbi:hypothetical protein R0K18_26885, partial [Pantoea sp. SIMBA_133]
MSRRLAQRSLWNPCISLAPRPDLFMEEIGNRVDGRFHHGYEASDEQVTSEKVSHGKSDGKMGEGERYRLYQRLVAIR